MKTPQETFDHIVSKIIEQGRGSYFPAGNGVNCRYRGPDGIKCAAGQCIADEDYSPGIEGLGVGAAPLVKLLRGWCLTVVGRMQEAHDSACYDEHSLDVDFMEQFTKNSLKVAEQLKLDSSICGVQG